jgi:hypothetical protein
MLPLPPRAVALPALKRRPLAGHASGRDDDCVIADGAGLDPDQETDDAADERSQHDADRDHGERAPGGDRRAGDGANTAAEQQRVHRRTTAGRGYRNSSRRAAASTPPPTAAVLIEGLPADLAQGPAAGGCGDRSSRSLARDKAGIEKRSFMTDGQASEVPGIDQAADRQRASARSLRRFCLRRKARWLSTGNRCSRSASRPWN